MRIADIIYKPAIEIPEIRAQLNTWLREIDAEGWDTQGLDEFDISLPAHMMTPELRDRLGISDEQHNHLLDIELAQLQQQQRIWQAQMKPKPKPHVPKPASTKRVRQMAKAEIKRSWK